MGSSRAGDEEELQALLHKVDLALNPPPPPPPPAPLVAVGAAEGRSGAALGDEAGETGSRDNTAEAGSGLDDVLRRGDSGVAGGCAGAADLPQQMDGQVEALLQALPRMQTILQFRIQKKALLEQCAARLQRE